MTKTIVVALAASALALGGDKPDDFNGILKRVESHYGKRHMRIPFIGLATFASHFTRPLGASDFKIAVIEGVDARSSVPDFEPGPGWKAFIRTTSRSGEHTVMYARDEGEAVRTFMLVVDRDEAVVMQMRLNPSRFAKLLEDHSH